MIRLRVLFTSALMLFVIVACGGAPIAPTQRPTTQAPTPPVVATSAPQTQGPVSGSTQGPVTAPTQAPPAGGQGIADFCLNTDDEVGAAMGVPVARSDGNENPGFGGGCLYLAADGGLIYSIGIVPVVQGVDMITTALQTPGAVAVTGLGERAVLVSAQGPLVYELGDWTISTGGAPTLGIAADPAAYKAALEQLARQGAARLQP
jgi:hypothetical protein